MEVQGAVVTQATCQLHCRLVACLVLVVGRSSGVNTGWCSPPTERMMLLLRPQEGSRQGFGWRQQELDDSCCACQRPVQCNLDIEKSRDDQQLARP